MIDDEAPSESLPTSLPLVGSMLASCSMQTASDLAGTLPDSVSTTSRWISEDQLVLSSVGVINTDGCNPSSFYFCPIETSGGAATHALLPYKSSEFSSFVHVIVDDVTVLGQIGIAESAQIGLIQGDCQRYYGVAGPWTLSEMSLLGVSDVSAQFGIDDEPSVIRFSFIEERATFVDKLISVDPTALGDVAVEDGSASHEHCSHAMLGCGHAPVTGVADAMHEAVLEVAHVTIEQQRGSDPNNRSASKRSKKGKRRQL